MKRFLIVFILVLLVPFNAFALDGEEYNDLLSGYDLSAFKEELGSDTYEILTELGLDEFDYNNLSSLSFESVIDIVKEIILGKIKSPIKSMLSILIFIILSALFKSMKTDENEEMSSVYSTCAALIIAVLLTAQISPAISLSASSIKVAGSFIYAFVPVFCAIVAASGGLTTGFATNSMLLMLSQGLTFLSSNVFMPLINCFLAIGICSSLRSELNLSNLIETLKKVLTSVISVLCAGFISILSVKTTVSAKADMLGIRSVRFLINSVVPVIGGSVSEGLLSIQSYSSLIKSTVGIVGIISIAVLFLPSIIEISLWRLTLSACSLISDVFGDSNITLVLKAFKDTALMINVVLVLSMVTTIISFGLLIAARTV
ncbi:MAG: hypothetical protein E7570_06000 [Ruminococcaceae bacterium]|nr:hypothetical protein [Oscillospiraceae bacterium]